VPNTFTKIASVSVGAGGANSVSFTSIPATFTDLALYLSVRSTRSLDEDGFSILFNSSSSNFTFRRLGGDGSGPYSNNAGNNTIGQITAANTTANTFTNMSIYIPNYAGSTNKSVSIDNVTEANTTKAYAQLQATLWSITSAITSISFESDSLGSLGSKLAQYTTATLYGIKNS
jgi:hypothetical protein